MLNVNDKTVRELLLKGSFGLERESLRITHDGYMAQTPNPFEGNEHIIRDFAENQTEINTSINSTPAEAIAEIAVHDKTIHNALINMEEPELLWPFSNPPYIRNEKDVPIAQYYGDEADKTTYREYLSDRYGRYKMTFCGIHFNYSFAKELIEASAKADGAEDIVAYKDNLYLTLARRCVAYGWIITAITAASPTLDSSFVEQGKENGDVFMGISSVRSSELGYWNFFAPILDYSSPAAYADSIQSYVDNKFIKFPSELYYPVRLKPKGAYGMDALRAGDISHIELRNIDLNPLCLHGIHEQDVFFAQLLLIWLASTPDQPFDEVNQIQAVSNFKNASHYDLRTVKIVTPDGEVFPVEKAGKKVINFMRDFFKEVGAPKEVFDCLKYQKAKFKNPENLYAWKIHQEYGKNYVQKGLALARKYQNEILGE